MVSTHMYANVKHNVPIEAEDTHRDTLDGLLIGEGLKVPSGFHGATEHGWARLYRGRDLTVIHLDSFVFKTARRGNHNNMYCISGDDPIRVRAVERKIIAMSAQLGYETKGSV